MAKKKNITPEKIIEWYMDDVLTNGKTSKTVYAFAKANNFDEATFYEHFSSFEALEKSIFALFCTKTMALLQASEEYQKYDAKNKLLSFYFTFFELLAANRSYVSFQLKDNKNTLKSISMLSKLRHEFLLFAKQLHIKPIDFKNDKINDIQNKGIEESLWIQLLMILRFWLNDESQNFEKTDVFIEKSIKAQFDIMDATPVKSVFDFVKFLFKETTM